MTAHHAEIVLDTATAGLPRGVRALDADGRQLVFRQCGVQVEVMLQSSRRGPVLWGKVLRTGSGLPCSDARAVVIDRANGESADARTDVFGEFRLASAGGLGGVLRVEFEDDAFVCWLGVGGSRPATEVGARS